MKLKLIAATLAILAAGTAHADIDTMASGNGEMFLSVYNNAGSQFVFDFDDATAVTGSAGAGLVWNTNAALANASNFNMAGFGSSFNAAGIKLEWDLTGSAWTSFKAVATASGSIFDVKAGDGSGSVPTDFHYLSTAVKSTDRATNFNLNAIAGNRPTNTQAGAMDNVDAMLVALNNRATSTGADDQYFVTSTDGDYGTAQWANGQNNNWKNNTPFWSFGKVGDELNFWAIDGNTGAGTARTIATEFGGNFSLDYANDKLVYQTVAVAAPIPEADTYALMLAGIGLVGFLARRRKAA